jgi:hypothetical protein
MYKNNKAHINKKPNKKRFSEYALVKKNWKQMKINNPKGL